MGNVTLDADLDCSGYVNEVLVIGADNITFDWSGFTIKWNYNTIYMEDKDNITIKNVKLEGRNYVYAAGLSIR